MQNMRYKNLPGGRRIPVIGLGTYGLNGTEDAGIISRAIAMGYRHIDTAANYGNETVVGRGIRDSGVDRETLFLTSKVDRNDLSEADFIASCEASLRRLDTPYLDLLLVHWPNDEIPAEQTIRAFDRLIRQRKIRYAGVSNFIRKKLDAFVEACPFPVITNQVEYHALLNQKKLLEHAEAKGMFLTAYSPLAQGKVLEHPVLREMARRKKVHVATLALAWLLYKGLVVIPKASSDAHMKANLEALSLTLSREDLARIDAIGEKVRVINWWPGSFDEDSEVF